MFRAPAVRYPPMGGDIRRHLRVTAQHRVSKRLKEPDSHTVVLVAAYKGEGTEVGPQLVQK